jgi:hypothetical protein
MEPAHSILEKVVAHYAAMRSYSDLGEVRRHISSEVGELSTIFSTSFRRPSLFRFEFATPHPDPALRHIVTRTNEDVTIDEIVCYSLTANHPDHEVTYEIAIEQPSLLLRKFVSSDTCFSSTEVRRNIRVDQPIEEELFARPAN